MKKIYLLFILVISLMLCGCTINRLSPVKITSDAIVMYSTDKNLSVVIEDQSIVKELTAVYNTLKLKKSDDKLDPSSTINLVYYENKKEKAVLTIDKNGILYLYRDEDNAYKVLNKEFDYKQLEETYNSYKKKE